MQDRQIHAIIKKLEKSFTSWTVPAVTQVAEQSRDPFQVLISCILSLRNRDEITAQASARLFARARTPQQLLSLSVSAIEKLIYPVCFYRTKARTIHKICHHLLGRFLGKVPDEIEDLLTLPGVGRKTANLVRTLGFNKLGICVDTHVHRISNRLGYIRTRFPDESEMALRKKLPQQYWIRYNDLLVSFGQSVCKPISPLCSRCPVETYCSKIGVTYHR